MWLIVVLDLKGLGYGGFFKEQTTIFFFVVVSCLPSQLSE